MTWAEEVEYIFNSAGINCSCGRKDGSHSRSLHKFYCENAGKRNSCYKNESRKGRQDIYKTFGGSAFQGKRQTYCNLYVQLYGAQ